MTPIKGAFAVELAYVTFSWVCTGEILYIINYTFQNMYTPSIKLEMQRLKTKMLPEMPQCPFDINPAALCLLHLNIGNVRTKLPDVAADNTFKGADVISLNETSVCK